jgi:hypothetical protein
LRHDLEIEVLGLHLTVQRAVGLAVLACLFVLLTYTISSLGGDNGEAPPIDNTTHRYQEDSTNWPLCLVFVFLGLVVAVFLVIEVGQ